MTSIARLSSNYFGWLFQRATGLPPYQHVLARSVERAQQLLQRNRVRFLAKLAARAGFSDQSQLSHHFKRLVGVTPGQFRMPARTF
jgi:AraC family transcriptional regulator